MWLNDCWFHYKRQWFCIDVSERALTHQQEESIRVTSPSYLQVLWEHLFATKHFPDTAKSYDEERRKMWQLLQQLIIPHANWAKERRQRREGGATNQSRWQKRKWDFFPSIPDQKKTMWSQGSLKLVAQKMDCVKTHSLYLSCSCCGHLLCGLRRLSSIMERGNGTNMNKREILLVASSIWTFSP